MDNILKVILINLMAEWTLCTIDGISYMDPLIQRLLPNRPPSAEDPCKSLYWYPRPIPEYCNIETNKYIISTPRPIPVAPFQPMPPFMPMPAPVMPIPPLPFGIPLNPLSPMLPVSRFPYPPLSPPLPPPLPPPFPLSPMLPVSSFPYPPSSPLLPPPLPSPYPFVGVSGYKQQAGLVPGIDGIVSEDGGINILPFSDAYSDLLEKHKHKMIQKRLEKLFRKYEGPSRGRGYRRSRRYLHEI